MWRMATWEAADWLGAEAGRVVVQLGVKRLRTALLSLGWQELSFQSPSSGCRAPEPSKCGRVWDADT